MPYTTNLYLRRMQKSLAIIIFFTWFSTVGLGQTSMPNQLVASQIQEHIVLDGHLSEGVWQEAMFVSNFTQRELHFGEAVTEKTEVAVLYDDYALYIGVRCYDAEADDIIAKEYRRDFNPELDDNFQVIIDTYRDQRNGFAFITNPNAARTDYQVFNNGGSINLFWNGVWDVRTQRNSEGWFAEFRIPLATLKYPKDRSAQEWGINFERNIRRKREQARWQGWSRNNQFEMVNQAGLLTGLEGLRQKAFVEVKPYVIGGAEFSGNDPSTLVNGGGDINYLITPAYRLNVTLNTDFAQVESDQQQINITRFPLFFPELREFFLEGNDFFDFNFGGNRIIPFYTRRIGLDSNRQTVPIIGGARLLGKEKSTTVGLMSIQTGGTRAQPTINYTTGSWRKDLGTQSFVGAISTNSFQSGKWHTTSAVNGRYATANFFGKNLNFGGTYVRTYNSDEEWHSGAYAYRAFVGYPNDIINIFASTQQSPEEFNPEVGLMRRRNFQENFIIARFQPRPKKRLTWIRQFLFTPLQVTYTQYNDTKDLQTFDYRLGFLGFDTRSGESLRLAYNVRAEGLIQEFNLSPEIAIPAGEYWWNEWSASVETFAGRDVSFEGSVNFGDFYTGRATRLSSGILWRTSRYFNLFLRYEKNYINFDAGKLNTDLIGFRSEYALNPNLFGSVLTQWNSSQQEMNFNFRLQFIPKIGADFFLIVNQIYDTNDGKWDPERGTILGKLIWRFVL